VELFFSIERAGLRAVLEAQMSDLPIRTSTWFTDRATNDCGRSVCPIHTNKQGISGQALIDPADTLMLSMDHQTGLFQTMKDISVPELRGKQPRHPQENGSARV